MCHLTKDFYIFSENPDLNPADIIPDGRYSHIHQVQERLSFLRFLLKVNGSCLYLLHGTGCFAKALFACLHRMIVRLYKSYFS